MPRFAFKWSFMQSSRVGPLDLFHQLPCPSMVTNVAGQVLISNALLLKMLGCTQDELIGTELAKLLVPEDRHQLRASIWTTLTRKLPVCEQYLHLQLPHETVPVLVNAQECEFEGAPDLPPPSRTTVISKKSVNQENDGYEEKQIH